MGVKNDGSERNVSKRWLFAIFWRFLSDWLKFFVLF